MKDKNKRVDSRFIFAVMLIVLGTIWAMQRIGIDFKFWHFFTDHILYPFGKVFSYLIHIIFSWPMIMVVVGVTLLAGKRTFGWVFLIIGWIFLVPRIFHLEELSFSLVFPIALITMGILMVVRALK